MRGWELLQKWVIELLGLADRCVHLPMATPDCRPFWTVAMYASFVVAGWIFYQLAALAWRDYKRHREVLARELAELTIAPPDVMRDAAWKGDDALAGAEPQVDPDVIKRAILARRQEPARPSAATAGPTC